jgi:hypothetical protein
MDKHIKELKILLGFFFLYPWLSTGYVMYTLKLDGIPFKEQLSQGVMSLITNSALDSAFVLIPLVCAFYLSKSRGKIQYLFAVPCMLMLFFQVYVGARYYFTLQDELKYMLYARLFLIASWLYITAKYFWVAHALTRPSIGCSR